MRFQNLKFGKECLMCPSRTAWFLALAIVVLSCSKEDIDPMIDYEGKVYIYKGPIISDFNLIDRSDLEVAKDISIEVIESGPCSGWFGGTCETKTINIMVQTNVNGDYSFRMLSRADRYYYVNAKFPEGISYSSTRGERQDQWRSVIFADIILVDIP